MCVQQHPDLSCKTYLWTHITKGAVKLKMSKELNTSLKCTNAPFDISYWTASRHHPGTREACHSLAASSTGFVYEVLPNCSDSTSLLNEIDVEDYAM